MWNTRYATHNFSKSLFSQKRFIIDASQGLKYASYYDKMCDALLNSVTLAQFKKREKHPSTRVTFSKVAGFR